MHVGSGTTLTTFYMRGVTCVLQAAAGVTTVEVEGGQLTTEGAFAITTMTVNDGIVYPHSTGTVTTLNKNGGTVDARGSALLPTLLAPFGWGWGLAAHSRRAWVRRWAPCCVVIQPRFMKPGG